MKTSQIEISAQVSPETAILVEQFAKIQGIQKAMLVEAALLHHVQALQALPEELIVPPKVVVSAKTGEVILEQLENPPEPTDAMKALFKDD